MGTNRGAGQGRSHTVPRKAKLSDAREFNHRTQPVDVPENREHAREVADFQGTVALLELAIGRETDAGECRQVLLGEVAVQPVMANSPTQLAQGPDVALGREADRSRSFYKR